MADFKQYFPKLISLEGGYSDDPDDKGGPTKYGVTIYDWKKYGYDVNKDGKIDADDVKAITIEDAERIAKIEYWDVVQGDDINSQSVAEFIADWAYNSGVRTAVKRVQRLLGLTDDGILGPITLKSINSADPHVLFDRLKAAREAFFNALVK